VTKVEKIIFCIGLEKFSQIPRILIADDAGFRSRMSRIVCLCLRNPSVYPWNPRSVWSFQPHPINSFSIRRLYFPSPYGEGRGNVRLSEWWRGEVGSVQLTLCFDPEQSGQVVVQKIFKLEHY